MIDQRANQRSGTSLGSQLLILTILILATGLRSWNLGQLSFWYDEVVTMRLAQSSSPAALVRRLFEIDATRAPLHPLLLQAWITLFGASEVAGRSFSVLCGVATVGLVCWMGRMLFEERTGLWAAYLTALSPPLIYYAREARMYAWLVMLTCLCWGLLFSLPRMRNADCGTRNGEQPRSRLRLSGYCLALTALIYSHPLGLLMAATLALGSLGFARLCFGSRAQWLAAHLASLILAAPWLRNYFDHAPEFVSGRLPIRFLIGTPIGFLGGNFLVLLGLLGLIGYGLFLRRKERAPAMCAGPVCLVLWLVVPPTLLYAYSWIGKSVFGPARYTLFVAPAFLILVAQGLATLPALTRCTTGIGLTLLAVVPLESSVYAPDLKADWRALAGQIRKELQSDPGTKIRVVVRSSDSSRNVEVETARYYMPGECEVSTWDDFRRSKPVRSREWLTYVVIGVKEGASAPPPNDPTWELDSRYPGLAVYWAPPPASPPEAPEPAAPGGSDRD